MAGWVAWRAVASGASRAGGSIAQRFVLFQKLSKNLFSNAELLEYFME